VEYPLTTYKAHRNTIQVILPLSNNGEYNAKLGYSFLMSYNKLDIEKRVGEMWKVL